MKVVSCNKLLNLLARISKRQKQLKIETVKAILSNNAGLIKIGSHDCEITRKGNKHRVRNTLLTYRCIIFNINELQLNDKYPPLSFKYIKQQKNAYIHFTHFYLLFIFIIIFFFIKSKNMFKTHFLLKIVCFTIVIINYSEEFHKRVSF